jgi:ubiquinone/menaquinone biosynthesis C-methylase UbiE
MGSVTKALDRLRRVTRRYVTTGRFRATPLDPVHAYDLLAESYDDQPNNVLHAADDALFSSLLERCSIRGRSVVDVGCGTGRHWKRILACGPSELIGYDISPSMLNRLRVKYPGAVLRLARDHNLPGLPAQSCELVISTLTLGYVPDCEQALVEWVRVLKSNGQLIVTDLHPGAAGRADRSFCYRGITVAIRHYVHSISDITTAAARHGLRLLHVDERSVDETLRSMYEAQDALALFDRTRGTQLIYGLHFQKFV